MEYRPYMNSNYVKMSQQEIRNFFSAVNERWNSIDDEEDRYDLAIPVMRLIINKDITQEQLNEAERLLDLELWLDKAKPMKHSRKRANPTLIFDMALDIFHDEIIRQIFLMKPLSASQIPDWLQQKMKAIEP